MYTTRVIELRVTISMLKQLTIGLSSAVMLSATVAHGATTPQRSVDKGSILLAQTTCVTETQTYPTANANVAYVTEESECVKEKGGVNIGGEVFAVDYDPVTRYYYVMYNDVRWYFVNWNGVTLLTNGTQYVAFSTL